MKEGAPVTACFLSRPRGTGGRRKNCRRGVSWSPGLVCLALDSSRSPEPPLAARTRWGSPAPAPWGPTHSCGLPVEPVLPALGTSCSSLQPRPVPAGPACPSRPSPHSSSCRSWLPKPSLQTPSVTSCALPVPEFRQQLPVLPPLLPPLPPVSGGCSEWICSPAPLLPGLHPGGLSQADP